MANKKRLTNRQILECIEGKVARIDNVNNRVDGVYAEIIKLRTDVSKQITDFKTSVDEQFGKVDEQFTNHLSVHTIQRKWYIRTVLGLVGLIVIAVGYNNLDALVKIGASLIRWV